MADGSAPPDTALLEGAPCGLLRTDGAGEILQANDTFCTWVGFSREALVGKRRIQDLLTVGGRIFHQTHWHPLLQMQGSVSEVKLDVLRSDGEKLPMMINAIRRRQGAGFVHDIAAFIARDRDKYERELVLSRRKLETLVADSVRLHALARDRAVFAEQMVGIVSHDLRNPLSTIQMGTALLLRDKPTDAQARLLERIARATERSTRLIGELLDFTSARLGAGLAVSVREIDLHKVVDEAVEELSLAFPAQSLVRSRTGSGLCSGDADRLAQLVGNLVGNAAVYGQAGAPITVGTAVDSATYTVSVHNHGPAIAPEMQARLFAPMVRGEAEAGGGRSVGLGLFIVSEIAKAHGGSVQVASEPGTGTTFTAVLPRSGPPPRPAPG